MNDENAFLQELQDNIASEKITLPSLPDVALKVREAVESESSSVQDIAEIVSTDAGISARLLQVANSPLYRGSVSVDNIQMAVSRLGTKMVRSLVISLAMKGIFQPTTPAVEFHFRRVWENSVRVAGISRALSRFQPHLNTEQAMLAGLIHDIGALPILVHAETKEELAQDAGELNALLNSLGPTIGKHILQMWNFAPPLVAVCEHYTNTSYDGESQADYVDLVIVARLQALQGSDQRENTLSWDAIPSFEKLGLSPEIEVIDMEGVQEEVSGVNQMFLG